MGDSQKPSGQLKDFRVHRGRVIDGGSSISESQGIAPKQSTTPRQSSVTEWSSRRMDTNLEKMWHEWNDDLGGESLDLSTPVKAKQYASAPAPLPPERPIQGEARGPLSPKQEEKAVVAYSAARSASEDDSFSVSLALEERRMEREGVVDFSNTYRKQELLKLNTVEYAKLLQAQFRREIELFNEARRSASSSIQLYRVSKTEADFMLFRNGVKLVISATQSGRVNFAFNQYMGQVHAPSHMPQMEIEAQWGSLDQLIWTYRGEKIDVKDLVRYFLTEFVKQSYR
jgi:hypothetical protein